MRPIAASFHLRAVPGLLLLLLILVSAPPPLGGQEETGGDLEGQDHPALSRMPGFVIDTHREHQFGRHAFDLAGGSRTVEGRQIRIVYTLSPGLTPPSEHQILRNYVDAVDQAGGQVLHQSEYSATLRMQRDGQEIWVEVLPANQGEMYELHFIEPASMDQDVVADIQALRDLDYRRNLPDSRTLFGDPGAPPAPVMPAPGVLTAYEMAMTTEAAQVVAPPGSAMERCLAALEDAEGVDVGGLMSCSEVSGAGDPATVRTEVRCPEGKVPLSYAVTGARVVGARPLLDAEHVPVGWELTVEIRDVTVMAEMALYAVCAAVVPDGDGR